ncbi:MAG TPA: DUF5666 domain-containing protein [Mycobacterium sp.]
MQLNFEPARLIRFAILAAAGATALSVGACHSAKSPEAAPGDSVSGLIASVSGSAVQVTQETGSVTVDVSPSAKIDEFSVARLNDIAVGNCVRVIPAPAAAPGGAATASSVQRTLSAADGKCWQPKAADSPNQPVNGTVASVEGNTIKVTVTGANGKPSETEVTVNDNTQYSKDISTTSQAIAQGKCITARGSKDDGGTLQATVVTLGPANDGKCP